MIPDTDHHVHSRYSECCHEDYNLENIIKKQTENGLRYICVTDHIHCMEETGGLAEHFGYLQDNPGIAERNTVFIGAELTIAGNKGNFPLSFLKSGEQPDFLIGGCHSIREYRIGMGDINSARLLLVSMNDNDFLNFTDVHYQMLKGAVQKGIINILAHPYDLFFRCGIFDSRLLGKFQKIARICRKNDIAVEINNASARRCLSPEGKQKRYNKYSIESADFYMKMIKIAADEGVFFSTGSDAHDEMSIGNMEYAAKVIEKAETDRSQLFYLDNGEDNKRYLSGR